MFKTLQKLYSDEGGSYFIEVALTIIVLVFAVASDLSSLGSTTGTKIGELQSKISGVGTP